MIADAETSLRFLNLLCRSIYGQKPQRAHLTRKRALVQIARATLLYVAYAVAHANLRSLSTQHSDDIESAI